MIKLVFNSLTAAEMWTNLSTSHASKILDKILSTKIY